MAKITVRTNGQTLLVNASVSHWTTEALAVTASGTNDVESTTTTTITSDYDMHFANTATTATITVTQPDGTTLVSQVFEVNPGVGPRVLNPVPDVFQSSQDAANALLNHPRYLTTGEMFLSRDAYCDGSVTSATQTLVLNYFTSLKTETTTNITVATSTTAAAATPSLCRMGMWEADAAGALTAQVGATANDTALFASTSTIYTKAFATPFTRTAGKRYAVGILVVSAGATPLYLGAATGGVAASNTLLAGSPRLAASAATQADLPSTLAAGSLTNVRAIFTGYLS